MSERATPETDAEAGYFDGSGCWRYRENGECVDADLARRLERERDEARDTIARLEGRACLICGASEPCELKTHEYAPCTFDPSPVDAARQFMRERDEAREALLEFIDMDEHDFVGICVGASEYREWLDRARAILAKAKP